MFGIEHSRGGGRYTRFEVARLLLMLALSALFSSGATAQSFAVGNASAAAGEPFSVDVIGEWVSSPEGVQAIIEVDDPSTILDTVSIEITSTITDSLGAEFVVNEYDSLDQVLVLSVLLDFLAPFDQQTYPPTIVPLTFARIEGTLATTAVPSDVVTFDFLPIYTLDIEPLENLIVVSDQAQIVSNLTAGSLGVDAPPVTFVRGDANRDGSVGLGDAVFVLQYLFSGNINFVLECPDAADVSDNGNVNFEDVIWLLNALFSGGVPPRPPFPLDGTDPTDDGLGCD